MPSSTMLESEQCRNILLTGIAWTWPSSSQMAESSTLRSMVKCIIEVGAASCATEISSEISDCSNWGGM